MRRLGIGVPALTFTFRPEDASEAFTRQVSVSPSGAFHLTDLPRKLYTVHIKGAKWLAANMVVDVRSSDVSDGQAIPMMTTRWTFSTWMG